MKEQNLFRNVLITLLIGMPLSILPSLMDLPTILVFIIAPIGIILNFIGIASSILLIQHKVVAKK
ncbi:hypothetical protein MKX54_03725 [Alkalihalobacillus sp. FSL R5-0424]